MRGEVVSVGSELLLGQIVDTNSAFIAREFAAVGLDLYYKTTIGDNLARLEGVLRQALGRSHVIVTTGGIGPTADDVTREAVALAAGRELVFVPELMRRIEAFFAARGFALAPSNRRQAYVPAGSIPIENPLGTAPGFIVELGERCIITLPGVPREMEYLIGSRVLPYLRDRYGLGAAIRLRVLKTVGLGESRIGEIISDFMEKGHNPTVGTLAHPGQVDIRIAAKAEDPGEAERLITPLEAEIRRRLGDLVFGSDAETLEGVIEGRLRALGEQVAVLELGSGGSVTARLSTGAPSVFAGGGTLGDAAPAGFVGVQLEPDDGPEAKARSLAEAARKMSRADLGLGVCLEAVAGTAPPLMLAAICLSRDGTRMERAHKLGGDGASVRVRCSTLALDLLRRAVANPV